MKNFVLRCVNRSHPDIDLPDFSPVIIGRNRQTEITNSRLSRHHVKLTANVAKKQVLCQILGPNGSKLNGEKILHKDDKGVLKSGDKIELLEGLYEHLIVLEQSQEENSPKNIMVQVHLSGFFLQKQRTKNCLQKVFLQKIRVQKNKTKFFYLKIIICWQFYEGEIGKVHCTCQPFLQKYKERKIVCKSIFIANN